MADPVKFLSEEITLTTANTVSRASLVRLFNLDSTNNVLITVANSTANISSFTLGNAVTDECVVYVAKEPEQTVQVTGAATVKAVSVAYL